MEHAFSMIAVMLAAGAVTMAVTPAMIRLLRSHAILDIPNERSSHELPVPRGGGLSVLGVYAAANVALLGLGWVRPDATWLALSVPLLALLALGFFDDRSSLRVSTRLLVQGGAAAWAVWLGDLALPALQFPLLPAVDLSFWGPVFSWLWLVGFTNVFNFMDGINGLAGFQAVLAALALAAFTAAGGDAGFAWLAMAMAGCSLGFLRHNFPRARIFLGDAGSLPLGFFLAFGVLHASCVVPRPQLFVLTLLVVWPFFFDGVFTLLGRVLRRQRLGDAHRDHLYQLLVRAGCSHTGVTAGYAVAMLACAALAVAMGLGSGGRAAAGFYAVVLLSLACAGLILRFHAQRGAIAAREAGVRAVGEALADLRAAARAAQKIGVPAPGDARVAGAEPADRK